MPTVSRRDRLSHTVLGPILQKEVADKISTICIIPQTTANNTIPEDKPNIRNITPLPNRLQIQSQFCIDCVVSAPKHSITGYQSNGETTQPPIAFTTPLTENTVANQNIPPPPPKKDLQTNWENLQMNHRVENCCCWQNVPDFAPKLKI